MESVWYGVYTLFFFFGIRNLTRSLRSLVRFLKISHNSYVNTVLAHFPCIVFYIFRFNIRWMRGMGT